MSRFTALTPPLGGWGVIFALSIFTPALLQAQEFNAKVTVNSSRIEGTNKDVFTSLERSLNDFLNSQRWSAATFSPIEKIECSFTVAILTNPRDNYYQAELLVSARRPVYNSTYTTSLINFRDVDFEFEYVENTPLEFADNSLSSNIVATFAFYSYLILGLDFDSYALMGGSYFFRQAQNIVMQAQSNPTWTGWTPFAKPNNRHAIITAFMDESLKPYRELWYTYHRKGFDEMAANSDRGRTNILNALPVLKQINDVRSSSVLIQMFADSKLDEIVLLSSKATTEQKRDIFDLLNNIYPTMSSRLEPLKK
ncbi:MAG: DUF4835 family protein [Candidatus Azobacteroides sp.]|nr:DUF4835 family protein [Candidatus Azobacteroides sp.]